MNKYRKGRLLVLTGMLAFSTATVLVGSASADKGTIKVGSSSVDGSKGNDPKINGCVDIDTTSYPAGVHVTYTLQPPTGTTELGSADVGPGYTEHANLWGLIQTALNTSTQAGPYHINVTVDSPDGQKSKVFWLSDPWACGPVAPPSGGNT
jgi:hypothetical protein